MSTIFPIQGNFAAGELAPHILGQPESKEYTQGLFSVENWIPSRSGGITTRGGLRKLFALDASYGRVLDLKVNKWCSFSLVHIDSYFYVVDDWGPLTLSELSAFNSIVDKRFLLLDSAWVTSESGGARTIIEEGACRFIGGDEAGAYSELKQTITVVTGLSYYLELGWSDKSQNLEYTIKLGTTSGGSELILREAKSLYFSEPFTVPGGVGTVYLTVTVEGTTFGEERILKKAIALRDIYYYPSYNGHPYTKAELEFLQWEPVPSADKIYIVSPFEQPTQYTYDRATNSISRGLLSFTSTPASWGTNNYPAAIAFHEGRLWLGGEPLYPERLYASKSNDFLNLTTGSTAADALQVDITKKGAIRWIRGLDNLVIGTETGEHILTSQDGAITPSDIKRRQQSEYGSAFQPPMAVGTKILYVDASKTSIRDIKYSWTEEKWISRELNDIAIHLSKRHPFGRIAYARPPVGLLVIGTLSNEFFMASYSPEDEMIGWHRHTTDGQVIDVLNRQVDGLDRIQLLIRRGDPGSTYLCLEQYDPTSALDSWVEFSNEETPYTSVNVPHLANKTVDIFIDGSLYEDVSVAANGDITLPASGNYIKLGLTYSCTFSTLPFAKLLANLVSLGSNLKRWTNVVLRVYESDIPKIDGVRPEFVDQYIPVDSDVTEYTGSIEASGDWYNNEGKITISHDRPYKVQIAGIFGKLSSNSLM